MLKVKLILVLLFCFAVIPVFAYQGFNTNVQNSPMEFSISGGLSSSDTEKNIQGINTNFGGSGFALGVTGLGLINNYFGVGFDFSYSNNGYGKSEDIAGASTDIRMEHYTPLLFTKTYIISPAASPFALYVPLGVGLDFARITKRVDNDSDNNQADTLSGFALVGGLGAEVNFNNNTFLAVEGRYNLIYFMGSNDYDIARSGNITVALKAGIKFDTGYEFFD